MNVRALAFAVTLAVAAPAVAEAPPSDFFRAEVPLFDAPFNAQHFGFSMSQSLELTHAWVGGGNAAIDFGLGKAFEGKRPIFRWLAEAPALFVWLLLSDQFPLGDAWTHEEWHRAALNANGIGSRNGVNDLHFFASTVSVYGVSDAQLSALKAQSNRDLVRVESAGLEAQSAIEQRFQREWFFQRRAAWRDLGVVLWMKANTFFYLSACASNDIANDVAKANASEPRQLDRDFTGPDCNGWAYDLEHPNQPYAARGLHPLGGIDRYRTFQQLSPAGRGFLDATRWLSATSLLSPALFGVERLPLPFEGASFNFAVFPTLAPFGQVIDLDVMLSLPFADFLVVYHQYVNGLSGFPGLEVALVRYELPHALRVTVGAGVWLQPKQSLWWTRELSFGAFGRARLEWQPFTRFFFYAEADAKSDGWVQGIVYLGPAAEGRVGAGLAL